MTPSFNNDDLPLPCSQRSNRSIFFPKSPPEDASVLWMAAVWRDEALDATHGTASDLESQLLAFAIERAGVDAQYAGGVFAARAALEQ
jgi:hypothetical protein